VSQNFNLYLPRESWLHRLDPRAKLWAVLLAAAVGLLFKQIGVLAGLLLVAHLALLSARIPASRIGWLWTRLAPLLAMILILQPLFNPGPGPDLLHVGPLRLTAAGMLDGISFALRAATLAFVVAVLLLATDPAHIVQGLVKLGLPYPWGLTVGLAIRYLPTTYGLFVAIDEAQQARGWIVGQGNLVQRARSYLPILVATIIAALRLSDNLGMALAARGLGYPARRTALHDIQFSWADWLAVALIAIFCGGLVALRFGLGFGAEPW
jgi:energy-coupling factor transport system permease protein